MERNRYLLAIDCIYDNVWFRKRQIEFQGLSACFSASRGWILSQFPLVTTNHSLTLNLTHVEMKAISHPTSSNQLCPLFDYQTTDWRAQCLETRLFQEKCLLMMHAFWSTDYLTKQGTLNRGTGGCSDGHHYHVEVFWAMVVHSKLCCQQLGGKSRIQVCTSQSLNFWPGKKVLV